MKVGMQLCSHLVPTVYRAGSQQCYQSPQFTAWAGSTITHPSVTCRKDLLLIKYVDFIVTSNVNLGQVHWIIVCVWYRNSRVALTQCNRSGTSRKDFPGRVHWPAWWRADGNTDAVLWHASCALQRLRHSHASSVLLYQGDRLCLIRNNTAWPLFARSKQTRPLQYTKQKNWVLDFLYRCVVFMVFRVSIPRNKALLLIIVGNWVILSCSPDGANVFGKIHCSMWS